MHRYSRFFYKYISVVCLTITLAACTTLDYRGIQAQFDTAVRIDNGRSVSAFTKSSVFTESGFDEIISKLTPKYIGKLDERLRSNAYLLLAFSQWRIGQLIDAHNSAQAGLNETMLKDYSRDKVLLKMIPALVVDTEIEEKWKVQGKTATKEEYQNHALNYMTIFKKFKNVKDEIGPSTPETVKYYLHYQKWRVAKMWSGVIYSIYAGTEEQKTLLQNKAFEEAKTFFGGKDLTDVANAERDAIPGNDGLRALIRAQGGG